MPITSISTVSAPRSNGGSGSSSKPKPVSGHQNTSVLFHAPSNTRWRNIPIGRPSKIAQRTPSHGDEHDDHEHDDRRHDAVQRTCPAEHTVSEREHRADDQEAVIEPRIVEDEADRGQRGTDEPEEHAGRLTIDR